MYYRVIYCIKDRNKPVDLLLESCFYDHLFLVFLICLYVLLKKVYVFSQEIFDSSSFWFRLSVFFRFIGFR